MVCLPHHRLSLLCLIAISTSLFACDSKDESISPELRSQLKAELRAELLEELRSDMRPRRTITAAEGPSLTARERAAIAEARVNNRDIANAPAAGNTARAPQPVGGSPQLRGNVPPVVSPGTVPPSVNRVQPNAQPQGRPVSATNLTQADLAAAADDPASIRVVQPVPVPVTPIQPSVASSGAVSTSPRVGREGVTMWNTTGQTELVDLVIGTGVESRQIQGAAASFPVIPELFYCFTIFKNTMQEATVTHIWRRGTRLVSKVELKVGKSPKWRTWSRQRTKTKWTGPWSCEVVGSNGERLGLAKFNVGG